MYRTVNYTSFDTVIQMLAELGKEAYIGKMDIKLAFRLLPINPADFDLLGIKNSSKVLHRQVSTYGMFFILQGF